MRIARVPSVIVVAAVMIGGFVSVPVSSDAQEPAEPPEARDGRIAQLERRVEELSAANEGLRRERDEARRANARLERQAEQLRKRLAERPMRLAPPMPRYAMPPLPGSPGGEPAPPNWVPREFNGIRYYVIPLGGEQQGKVEQ